MITEEEIQEKYNELGYKLQRSNLIYNFITMKNFPQNLRYFDREFILENIRYKALEALKQSEEYKKNTYNRNERTMFGIVVPILDEFFKDIEQDVDHIFTLMQQEDKYQLFIKSKNDNYTLNGNCIFLQDINYGDRRFKVNTSFELSPYEAIKETKEFIRSFLITVTMSMHLGDDRDFILTHQFAVITDTQYQRCLLLLNFIIVGNGKYRDSSNCINNKTKDGKESFTLQRASTAPYCGDYGKLCPSIGSYLTMILKQLPMCGLEDPYYIDTRELEEQLLIPIHEEDNHPDPPKELHIDPTVSKNPTIPHEQGLLTQQSNYKQGQESITRRPFNISIFLYIIIIFLIILAIYHINTKITPDETVNKLNDK